jgi:hypothetical protein
MEAVAGVTPSSAMYHYVVKIEGAFAGFLQHLIDNRRAGVTADMTTTCAMNTTPAATASGRLDAGTVYSSAQPTAQSYLRFYNTGTAAGTAMVTLSDGATGQTLGQWTSPSIPSGAAPQFSIAAVESGTGAAFTRPAFYAVSVTSGFGGSFQHVLFRAADGTLTNLSTCGGGVTANRTALANVHSSLLGAYPSSIVVNNTAGSAATVTLALHDARTGQRLGAATTPSIAAGGHAIIAISFIEGQAQVSPAPDKYHYVVRSEGAFSGYLQHLVENTQAGVTTDMSTVCALPSG